MREGHCYRLKTVTDQERPLRYSLLDTDFLLPVTIYINVLILRYNQKMKLILLLIFNPVCKFFYQITIDTFEAPKLHTLKNYHEDPVIYLKPKTNSICYDSKQ